MTIAEKLTKIAENEQKIFEAGYTKGLKEGGPANLFIFYDEYSNKYEAIPFEEGMTWGEWCASEYNTKGWYISDWDSVYTGAVGLKDMNDFYPNGSTAIINYCVYQYGY